MLCKKLSDQAGGATCSKVTLESIYCLLLRQFVKTDFLSVADCWVTMTSSNLKTLRRSRFP
jgi:hypothetical protein